MTHVEMMVAWFKARNNVATLREIAHSDEPWCWKFSANLGHARTAGLIEGWECDRSQAAITGKKSDHIYRIRPVLVEKPYIQTEHAA